MSWSGKTEVEHLRSIEILSYKSSRSRSGVKIQLRFSTDTHTYYADANSPDPSPADLDKCQTLATMGTRPALVVRTVHTMRVNHLWEEGKEVYGAVTTLVFYADSAYRENKEETEIRINVLGINTTGKLPPGVGAVDTTPEIVKRIDVSVPMIFEEVFVKELPSENHGP